MNSIFTIALNTFRESIRSKVLYVTLVFAILMILAATFFGSVTIGDQVKVIKDFGLFSISFLGVLFAVISGSTLLAKELSRKTIYNILAKPVKRYQFLLGKQIGLFVVAGVLVSLLGIGLVGFSYLFEQHIDLNLLVAVLFILLELLIVTSAVIFFSSVVVTPLLSGLFSFGLFLAGRSSAYVLALAATFSENSPQAHGLRLLHGVLPDLAHLAISDIVVYGGTISIQYLISAAVYSIAYSAVLLVLAHLVFLKRDFN